MCYMNIHEHNVLHQDVGRIALASGSITSGTCKSAYSLSHRTDHVGVTTMKRLDQGHLHSNLEVLGLTCPGWESNPGFLRGKQAL
jgi:hypothetical protein